MGSFLLPSRSLVQGVGRVMGNSIRAQWADGFARAEVPKWTRVSQRINPPGF